MCKRLTSVAIILAFSVVQTGCWDIDDYSNIQVDGFSPAYGFPFVNSTITLYDLLNNEDNESFLVVDSINNTLSLSFLEEFDFGLDLQDFKMPDKNFAQTFPVLPVSETIVFEDYTTIDFDSEINYLDMSGGMLEVQFSRNFNYDLDVELRLISITDPNNQIVTIVPDWSQNPNNSTEFIGLAGHKMDLYNEDEDLYNSFMYAISFGSVDPQNYDPNDELSISLSFTNLEFSKMVGNISYLIEEFTRELQLSVFDSITGTIHMDKPEMRFNVLSSFGIPGVLVLDNFAFTNAKGDDLMIENEILSANTLLVEEQKNYILPATEDDPCIETTLILDSDNSNFEDVFVISPNKAGFTGNFSIGDTLDDNRYNFYVLDTSRFQIKTHIEVPLFGWVEDLEFKIPMDNFTLPGLDSVEIFDDYFVELRLKTVNSLPFDFELQGVFFDANNDTIASLFDQGENGLFVKSPYIQDAEPLGPEERVTSIRMDKNKYETINRAESSKFTLSVDTGTDTEGNRVNVNIGPNYELQIMMSVLLKADIKPETDSGN